MVAKECLAISNLKLDGRIEKMSGYELAEKIRESGQKTPIISLTDNATKRNVWKILELYNSPVKKTKVR